MGKTSRKHRNADTAERCSTCRKIMKWMAEEVIVCVNDYGELDMDTIEKWQLDDIDNCGHEGWHWRVNMYNIVAAFMARAGYTVEFKYEKVA